MPEDIYSLFYDYSKSVHVYIAIISLYVHPADTPTLTIGEALSPTGNRAIDDIFGFRSFDDRLIVLDSSDLDRETLTEYNFTIVAMDSSRASSTATVTVTIIDFNDNPPDILNGG